MKRLLAIALLALAAVFPAAAQTFTGAMSGSWWDAARAGEGQFITFETLGTRNVVYLAYFTYTADGRATWQVGSADYAANATTVEIPLITGSGARFGNAFNTGDVRTAPSGTATLEFVSCTRMRMRHTAIAGLVLDLTRSVGPLAGAGCGDKPPAASSLTGVVSGSWWNAQRNGEGQFITFETLGNRNVAYLAYFTYAADGTASWLVGNADYTIGARTITIPLITGSNARFGTAFRSADVQTTSAGTATLELTSCSTLRLSYTGAAQTFAHDITRLVGPLTGLGCTDGIVTASPLANEVHTDQYASTFTGFTYPISISFPPGYVPGSANHPVIYSADSEFLFQILVGTVRERGYNAIVVSVGNGGSDRRFVDYVSPGWNDYFRFLKLELMPFIETRFRVDRTRRTFVGYSLSGSLAGVVMLMDDPADRRFGSFISIDGSFWNQTATINGFEDELFARTHALPVSMYLAAAENRASIANFRARLDLRSYTGLRVNLHDYALSHAAVVLPAIQDGLAFTFP
ncbi:alpha/beta hydrolase [Usitatibacter rugosus]|nr:alpha/beta hydrolase-fold protein [Usitatibacter rugosus]